MEQGFISQRFINRRRTARRLDDDINPAMMTNYNNRSLSDTELVAKKVLDIDGQGGYYTSKKGKSSAIKFNAQSNQIRPGRNAGSFERVR
tara:strand:- start:885 stop:1154 length:270 start_codon:yes stop_codon:yes gene_type:complete